MTARTSSFLALCFIVLFAIASSAEIRLPAVIGDHMVLQRETKAPLWGWANPDEKILLQGSWMRSPVKTVADEDGRWTARLKTPGAGGPFSITLQGENTITLNNVLIGEVWICSGQSNMEWPLAWSADAKNEIAAAEHPNIRLFTVKKAIAVKPRNDCEGAWAPCSPQTVEMFSAIGYYFGRELQRELKVPIGLINLSYGGSTAEAWMREKTLRRDADFAPILERLERAVAFETDKERFQKDYEAQLAAWWKAAEKADSIRDSALADRDTKSLSESGWQTMQIPQNFEEGGVGDFDGAVWFLKAVEIPKTWTGKALTLEFGPIDDLDSVWLNGKKVGGVEAGGRWWTARQYEIPAAAVRPGRNVIAVRVVDTGGPGGLLGKPEQLRLRLSAEEQPPGISLAGEWFYKTSFEISMLPPLPQPPSGPNLHTATTLYNAMVVPVLPYGIRGVIWYQGESNVARAYQYRKLFPAMIKDWRDFWAQGRLPFYFVQIAPYAYGRNAGTPELREAQTLTLSVPNTGMAVTMDIGNPSNIHPTNKVDVGKRLALWALAKTYGRGELVYSGPLYKRMKVEGDKIRLSFNHVGGGLMTGGKKLTHFTIAGKDRQFLEAEAVIEGDTVVVWRKGLARPVAVRYGWSDIAEPNLFNQEGLPASPFRTDNWPGVTIDNK